MQQMHHQQQEEEDDGMGNVGDQQQDYDENGESPMRAGDQEENMGQFDGNDMGGSPD